MLRLTSKVGLDLPTDTILAAELWNTKSMRIRTTPSRPWAVSRLEHVLEAEAWHWARQ